MPTGNLLDPEILYLNSEHANEHSEIITSIEHDTLDELELEEENLFNLFIQEFIDPFPIQPYRIKRSYKSGFILQKQKNSNNNLLLTDKWQTRMRKRDGLPSPTTYYPHKVKTVQDHLDFWCKSSPTWLGLEIPDKWNKNLIDVDNSGDNGKNIIKVWERKQDKREFVISRLTLDYLKKLKQVYDNFPNRIWCISSLSLGIHAWQIMESESYCSSTHANLKEQTKRIDTKLEVHPMPGRCLRIPFGRHYFTITENNLIENWQDQVKYFLNNPDTPSFNRIIECLLAVQEKEWNYFLSCNYNESEILKAYLAEREEVKRWLDGGCEDSSSLSPPSTYISVSSLADLPSTKEEEKINRHKSSPIPANENELDLRNGNWVFTLEEIARTGMRKFSSSGNSSLATNIHELSKFLFWIELRHLPELERKSVILETLFNFSLQKHNNCCSRLINPSQQDLQEVKEQIERIVKTTVNLVDNEQILNNMYEKWSNGKYARKICLMPLLVQKDGCEDSSSLSPPSTYISVSSLADPLPEEIVKRLDAVRGRNRIHDFACKFLNHLKNARGTAVISQETFYEFLGYENPNQLAKYKKIILQAEMVLYDTDQYTGYSRKGHKSKKYSLTNKAREIFGINPVNRPFTRKVSEEEFLDAIS